MDFSELFKGYVPKGNTTKKSWWESLSIAEREEERFKYYRKWLNDKHEIEVYNDDAFEYDGIVNVIYKERDTDIGNQFLYWKLKYLENNHYALRVYEKLENEIHLLYSRRNTELKKKRREGRVIWTERRFWRVSKDAKWCEVFFRYGRNKRYDLLGEDRYVLLVENKRSKVLDALQTIKRVYWDYFADEIDRLWIKRLEGDFKRSVEKNYDLKRALYEGKYGNPHKVTNASSLLIGIKQFRQLDSLIKENYNVGYFTLGIMYKAGIERIWESIKWDDVNKIYYLTEIFPQYVRKEGEKVKLKRSKWDRYYTQNVDNNTRGKGIILNGKDLSDLFDDN